MLRALLMLLGNPGRWGFCNPHSVDDKMKAKRGEVADVSPWFDYS